MKTRKNITKSRAGHYTAAVRNAWYGIDRKVNKIATLQEARREADRLLTEVEQACELKRHTAEPFRVGSSKREMINGAIEAPLIIPTPET